MGKKKNENYKVAGLMDTFLMNMCDNKHSANASSTSMPC